MKKFLENIIFAIYAIIAIFVTVCLLSYNDYKITEFGQYSLLKIDSNQLEPNYQKGDLVIVNKKDSIDIGDEIFFYNTYTPSLEVTLAKVTNAEKITSTEYTYTLDGAVNISSEYVLGPADTTTRIAGIGTILGILESKWGFLFLIVFPSLIAFLYEFYVVVQDIRTNNQTKETN